MSSTNKNKGNLKIFICEEDEVNSETPVTPSTCRHNSDNDTGGSGPQPLSSLLTVGKNSISSFLSHIAMSAPAKHLSFDMASRFHLQTRKMTRRNTVALLDESEHGIGKVRRNSMRQLYQRSQCCNSEGAEDNAMQQTFSGLDNPQVPAASLFWDQLGEVKFYKEGSTSLTFQTELDGKPVMVKLLKADWRKIDGKASERFSQEIELMAINGSCDNIINFVARGSDGKDQASFVVMEKLSETLLERLEKIRNSTTGWSLWKKKVSQYSPSWEKSLHERFSTCLDIARGLAYCHSNLQPGCVVVIHRDMNPSNVGFRGDGSAVIFDFGNARVIESYDANDNELPRDMTGDVGNLRYQSPEVSCHNPYGAPSDCYSFSIISWEILSMKVPFGDINTTEYLQRVVEGGERPPVEDKVEWPREFRQLLEECWDENPNLRPNMKQIVERMEGILKTFK